MERIVKTSSKEDGVIFDPFMGSGSTGVAWEYVPKEIKNRWIEMMENDSFGFYDAWEKENNGK